jgi:hypothetical protein
MFKSSNFCSCSNPKKTIVGKVIVRLIDSIVVSVTRMTNSNVDSSNECVGFNSFLNDHN